MKTHQQTVLKTQFRSCVEVEMGSPSLTVLVVSMDVKQPAELELANNRIVKLGASK